MAVVMGTRVAVKDEGNDEGGKSNGDGNKEGDCKKEGCGRDDDNEMPATDTMTTTLVGNSNFWFRFLGPPSEAKYRFRF
jgi:hypothetical protein